MPMNPNISKVSPHFMPLRAGMPSLNLVFFSRKNAQEQGIGEDENRREQPHKHRLRASEALG